MSPADLFRRTEPVVSLAGFYRAASDDITRMAGELAAAGWSDKTLREVRQMGFVAYVTARAEERDRKR